MACQLLDAPQDGLGRLDGVVGVDADRGVDPGVAGRDVHAFGAGGQIGADGDHRRDAVGACLVDRCCRTPGEVGQVAVGVGEHVDRSTRDWDVRPWSRTSAGYPPRS